MKKFICFTFLLGFVLLFSQSGVSQDGQPNTLGIRLDDDAYCDDFYVVVNELDHWLYDCHGYKYGCAGTYGITLAGAAQIYGGYVYFNFTLVERIGDWGGVATNMVMIDLGTRTGEDYWAFFYGSSDVPTTFGGMSTMSMTIDDDPGYPPPGADRSPAPAPPACGSAPSPPRCRAHAAR